MKNGIIIVKDMIISKILDNLNINDNFDGLLDFLNATNLENKNIELQSQNYFS